MALSNEGLLPNHLGSSAGDGFLMESSHVAYTSTTDPHESIDTYLDRLTELDDSDKEYLIKMDSNGKLTKDSKSSDYLPLTAGSSKQLTGDLYTNGNIIPVTTNQTLGTSDHNWQEARISTVYEGGTALVSKYLGVSGTAVSASSVDWDNVLNKKVVTSIGLSMPSEFVVTNTPVTSSGVITVTLNSNNVIPTTALVSSWNSATGQSHTHDNKSVLDTITSSLTGLWTSAYNWGNHATAGYLTTSVASETYQAKESGKGLSTNDYTTAEKNKLASLVNYELPTATTSVLGGVKLGNGTIQTVSANSPSTMVSRTYPVQFNSNSQMVVNVPWENTTYNTVTTSANGLMSSTDKIKLNGIETGALVNTITGVKGDSESTYRTGNVNITRGNLGLGDDATETLISNLYTSEVSRKLVLFENILRLVTTNLLPKIEAWVNEIKSLIALKISDIKINGTSIVSNNEADIITNSAYDSSTNKIATMSDIPTQATTSTLGTIKLGYDETTADKTYAVTLDSNGKAYVSVPWTGGSGGSGLNSFTVDDASQVYSNVGKIYTINANYDKDSNKLATESDLENYLPLSAGSSNPLTGDLYLGTNASHDLYLGTNSSSGRRAAILTDSNYGMFIECDDATNGVTFAEYSSVLSRPVYADIYAGNIYQNDVSLDSTYLGINDTAVKANKLATARTITLSGTVSGSASFDGSSDITITTTGSALSGFTVDDVSEVYNNVGKIYTINGDYDSDVNKLATAYDLENYFPLAGNETITGKIQVGDANKYIQKNSNNELEIVGEKVLIHNSSSSGEVTVASYNDLILDAQGNILAKSDIVPDTATLDLGTQNVPWNNLYATTIYQNGTSLANTYLGKNTAATSSSYGSIKIGYTESGDNYAVQLDSDGKAYVTVSGSSGNYLPLSAGDLKPLTGSLYTLHIYPTTNNTYDLGTASTKWANVYATTFYGTLSGKAATADKLATARTISLTGNCTGSGTFDGSGNLSISTTVSSATSATLDSQGNTIDTYYLPLSAGSTKPLTGDLYTQSIYPKSDVLYYLGDNDHYWSRIYGNKYWIATAYNYIAVENNDLVIHASNNLQLESTSGEILVSNKLRPDITETRDLGATNYKWNDVYAVNYHAATAFYQDSDKRLKNIHGELDLDKAYDLIDKCSTILYDLKEDKTHKELIGMIALEVQEFFPEIVSENEDGLLSLDYAKLTVIILRVMKDLIKRVKNLENI